MNIKTDRLVIRTFEPEDWQDVYAYTSNPNVMKYIPEGVFTEDEARKFVTENSGEHAGKFPVLLKNEKTVIGHIAFFQYFGDHTYEIGWVFHPEYQGKGYASEAARAVLAFGFNKMKLHRIIATCQPENTASHRVMEKIGMRREGFFKKCIPHDNEWWDEYYYAVLEEEWEASNLE
ncbi:GNAT family N-acetyltransferase [Bacillus velezensis]|uniref:GNAT family N-acetyltransferase n=1 Tax=Bacillus velezensis TaxID=492670 RepID=UPI0034A1ACF1